MASPSPLDRLADTALERLEQAREVGWVDAWTLVGNRHFDEVAVRPGAHRDSACPRGVWRTAFSSRFVTTCSIIE